MCKVIIFGGTTEGRRLSEFCVRLKLKTHVCTATEYGGSLIAESEYITTSDRRMDSGEMELFFGEKKPRLVIDATHPFAAEVTENIKKACLNAGIEYHRLLRDEAGTEESGSRSVVYVDSMDEAVDFLQEVQGKILLTTGSKELDKIRKLKDYRERVVARVLSSEESVHKCCELGFEGANLICMQGPFTKECNAALLRQYNCAYLLTKASGTVGGFEDKLAAAEECGAVCVVIGRPKQETGSSYFECKQLICKTFACRPEQHISLVGIGMGSENTLTKEAAEIIAEAEILIGARRIAEAVGTGKKVFCEYESEKIAAYIDEHCEYEKIAIVLSGDIGFYSGAKKLTQRLQGEGRVLSFAAGISSVAYFMAKIAKSWDDAVIVSNHGNSSSLIPKIRDNEKVFSILGKEDDVRKLAQKLTEYGLEDCKLYVGEQLSYKEEKIFCASPAELNEYRNDKLAVVMIENSRFMQTRLNPLVCRSDDEFCRGKVPMTKEEVRAVSVHKLRLSEDAVCWDIGAGTGSVSVEMAIKASKGVVYAVEKNKEAVSLLEANRKKFMADNMVIREGLAPEVLSELPPPTHIFIGGSSGNMRAIMQVAMEKNHAVRVVINCIAMESTAEALACAREFGCGDEEIVQLQLSRTAAVGSVHMMKGENPITITAFTGKGKERYE